MKTQPTFSPRRLSDRELIDQVKHLACYERQVTACLVAHLAELDERRLYVAEGCSSLFTYCTEILHLSEGAAYNRIEAARAARKFPLILQRLADGSIHLTAVRMLAQHLTEENCGALLDQATHRSKREVEEIVARIRPLPSVPASVRKLPGRPETAVEMTADGGNAEAELALGAPELDSTILAHATVAMAAGNATAEDSTGCSPPATPERPRAVTTALAPELYKVQFTADAETHGLLCQAKELLKHQIPDGDAGAVLTLALKLLVDKLTKQKFGAVKKAQAVFAAPTRSSSPWQTVPAHKPPSRYIPADVRREVWNRDGGRCAFIAFNGRRCAERGRLEFHHLKPFALGGKATTDNIQLRCRIHNAHESELVFGSGADSFRKESPRARANAVDIAERSCRLARGHTSRPRPRANALGIAVRSCRLRDCHTSRTKSGLIGPNSSRNEFENEITRRVQERGG